MHMQKQSCSAAHMAAQSAWQDYYGGRAKRQAALDMRVIDLLMATGCNMRNLRRASSARNSRGSHP